ncbi:MAG: dihydrodipicolinate synthase family protein [Akkermansiaceae bacterium]|nr:dihydrodipicolinate synthase family protein [Akkermansiaceae bacterium]MCP5551307.1 dihydrodipicolinate synthase family protein [Akkermansiaceae bacterium]
MQTAAVTPAHLRASVVAVPPLARDGSGKFSAAENSKIVRHLEAGGVTTLLYGGNANFYHIALSEYAGILGGLAEIAAENTLVTPSVGPAYGTMMDQAAVLRDFDFPTVMVLPQQGITTAGGVETGLRRFAEAFGKPVVVYIKHEGYTEPENVARLVADGVVSWVKYAIVREDTAKDDYLRALLDRVDPAIVVSGMGEQPAIIHLRDFALTGFTSGCVCVRPDLSAEMLRTLAAGDFDRAEEIRRIFEPLEDLRNAINPIRVLHDAVALAGLAETGPALPLLSNLDEKDREPVKNAALELLNR